MKKIVICSLIAIIIVFSLSYSMAATKYYDTMDTKYEGVVERITQLGIVNGVTSTSFAPYKTVTRAELAKIMVKMYGMDEDQGITSKENKSGFSDVKKSDWFYTYVIAANNLGIIKGYEDGTFRPDKEVSYAEVVAMMLRYLGYDNIKENSPNGWYWNYILKMRELELNDGIGEFNYTSGAIRGDVAMFVWNALISDRWSISNENIDSGFTYTTNTLTPLEVFFDEYSFLNKRKIYDVGFSSEGVGLYIQQKGLYFFTNEYVPYYVKGGTVTGLVKDEELFGVSFDDEYTNTKLMSGPTFYLKDQGYKLNKAKTTAVYGYKDKANYAYLIIDKDTNEILRAVYLDASSCEVIDTVKFKNASGDKDVIEYVTINDRDIDYENTSLIKDGFKAEWKNLKKGDLLVKLGDGLYTYGGTTMSGTVTDFTTDNELFINGEEFRILNSCECYPHGEKEATLYEDFSSKQLKNYIGLEAKLYLTIAQEVYKIEFSQRTATQTVEYEVGIVVSAGSTGDKNTKSIRISYGDKTKTVQTTSAGDFKEGQIVSVHKEDDAVKVEIISKDTTLKNNLTVKYNYEPSEIDYPLVGNYMVTKNTSFYKLTLKYENNSITDIEECLVKEMNVDKDLSALENHKLIILCDEYKEALKVFAVHEENKYDTLLAIVRKITDESDKKTKAYKVSLSVINGIVTGYPISERDLEKFAVGDIVLYKESGSADKETVVLVDTFEHNSIGYKRDLIVKDYDQSKHILTFENGDDMDLKKNTYIFEGKTIDIESARFLYTTVSKMDEWTFNSASIVDKEKFSFKKGDRLAIGELTDVIVVYRGYK